MPWTAKELVQAWFVERRFGKEIDSIDLSGITDGMRPNCRMQGPSSGECLSGRKQSSLSVFD